jgi:WD40 repeat protein
LATAGDGGTVVLNLATGRRRILPTHVGSIERVAFSHDGELVITVGSDGAEVWRGGKSRQLPIPGGLVSSAAMSADGRIVVVGTARGNTNTIDTRTRAFIGGAKGLDPVRAVGLSQDGKRAVLATSRGLTTVEEPAYLNTVVAIAGAADSIAFSPRGNLLAAAGADGRIRVWDLRQHAKPYVLRGHTGAVNSVAFSPDGRLLVTASDDGTARVWEWRLAAHQPVTLLGHRGPTTSASFSPDGRFVATAGADGTTRLHSCEPCGSLAQLVTRAQAR